MTDPVARSLANAPVDDEPVSAEEAREIAAAPASLDRGEGIPHEKVLAEFGLTSEDFARMGRTPLDSHKTDQAKAQLRAIDQPTALRILHALARYLHRRRRRQTSPGHRTARVPAARR